MPDCEITKEGLTGKRILIQTDDWFHGPDGQQYRVAWGKCIVHKAKDVLGCNPTKSTNWYLQVGLNKNTCLLIAGCRIHYAIVCKKKPIGPNFYIPDVEDR